MKKVLILAYDFPPYVSVGGLRPYAWYRYLLKYKVYPVVVSRQWEQKFGNELDYISQSQSANIEKEITDFGTIYKAPFTPNFSNKLQLKYGKKRFRFIRKVLSFSLELLQFIGPFGPKYSIYKSARAVMQKESFDVIIATGEPFVLFHYAKKLSDEFKTPWIADYRDPWSGDLNINRNWILKIFNHFMEKRIVEKVNYISTVSSFVHSKIKHAAPEVPFAILPNGYNPEIFESLDIESDKEILRFAFAGTIYLWHPIESFIKKMAEFIEANPDQRIMVSFYGVNRSEDIAKAIAYYGQSVSASFEIHPRIPNETLLPILKKSHVLVLFSYYSFMGTKIFDYIALKRKILFCYTNDPASMVLKKKYYKVDENEAESNSLQEDLIKYTNSGVLVENEAELRGQLNIILEEFKACASVACNSRNVSDFSREIQVQKLAEIINELS